MRSLVAGVGILLLAQVGSTLTGCGGESDSSGGDGDGGGAQVTSSGGAASGGGGGSSGGAAGGQGSGGIPSSGGDSGETCSSSSIAFASCNDGVVYGAFSFLCNEFTLECEGGCRVLPDEIPSWELEGRTLREYVDEEFCAPANIGGAAGGSAL